MSDGVKAGLHRILERIENRLDTSHALRVRNVHRASLEYREVERPPVVCYLPYEGGEFSPYPVREAICDPAKMMVNELLIGRTSIHDAVDLPDDAPYCLRPNLGVAIVASQFGARLRLLENDLPWVEPLPGGRAKLVEVLLDAPPPDPATGLVTRALEMLRFFREFLADYPNSRESLQIDCPDLQGPFSTLELLWGADIYVALHEIPDLVREMLCRVAEATAAVWHKLQADVRENIGPGFHYCHNVAVKGHYLLRNDSAINISPDHYRNVVMPADQLLADRTGSIGIHFCGNGRHHIRSFLGIRGTTCLDFGQPEKLDLDAIYREASAHKVPLVRVAVSEQDAPDIRNRFPTGVTLVHHPASKEAALRFLERYRGC